jgi:hypothetical protein
MKIPQRTNPVDQKEQIGKDLRAIWRQVMPFRKELTVLVESALKKSYLKKQLIS